MLGCMSRLNLSSAVFSIAVPANMLRAGAGLISREVYRPVRSLRVRLHWVHQRHWPKEGARSNSPGESQETTAVLDIGDSHVDSH